MSHLLRVDKTYLLAGLYWSHISSGQKTRKSIKHELNNLSYEFKQVGGGEAQFGAVHSTGLDLLIGVGGSPSPLSWPGKKAKVKSLACLALAAHADKRSFVGRLYLGDGQFWVVIIRSGMISPVGDLVVDESEIEEVFAAAKAKNSDLSVIFNSLDKDSSHELIAEWLGRVKARRLSGVRPLGELGAPPLTNRKLLQISLIATVVIASGVWGFAQYESYKEQKAAEEAAQRQAARDRINQLGPIPKPWQEWAAVSRVATACIQHYLNRSDYKYGWEVVNWTCDGSSAIQEWERTELGTYAFLPVEDTFDISEPNEIIQRESLGAPLEPRGAESIAPKDEIAKILMDAARVNGLAISLNWGNEEKRNYSQGGQQKVERFGYSLNTAKMSGKTITALEVLQTLSKIPGLKVRSITAEKTSFEIDIEFYTAV